MKKALEIYVYFVLATFLISLLYSIIEAWSRVSSVSSSSTEFVNGIGINVYIGGLWGMVYTLAMSICF